MRRRLDLAVTLILAPRVLFLDEPTTGLDPRNRNEVWSAIRELVAAGTTVLLTTQYLDEADQLADKVVVIDAGRKIAEGTPADLKAQIGGDRLDVVVPEGEDLATVVDIVGRATGGEATTEDEARRVSVPVAHRVTALTEVVRALSDAGVVVDDLGLRRPTLDDVFLELTGRRTDQTDGDEPPDPPGPPGPPEHGERIGTTADTAEVAA